MQTLTKKSTDVAHIKYLGFAREVFWWEVFLNHPNTHAQYVCMLCKI